MYPKMPPGHWRCLFCYHANGPETQYEQVGREYRKICKKCGASYRGSTGSKLGDSRDIVPRPDYITRLMILLWEEAP